MIWLAISLLAAALLLVLSAFVANRRAESIGAARKISHAFFENANSLLDEKQDELPPELLSLLSLLARINVSRLAPLLLLVSCIRKQAPTPAVDSMFRSVDDLPSETHQRFRALMIFTVLGLTYRLWILGPRIRKSLLRGQSPRHPRQPRDRAAQATKEIAQLKASHA